MERKVKDVLDRYQKEQPGYKVQRFIDFPCPWINYDDPTLDTYLEKWGDVNHREILLDEIVIDVDAEVIADGIIHADMVEKRLKQQNIYFERWISGGNGQHFHMRFPDLNQLFRPEYIEDVKYALIEFLLKGIINPELDSHICLFKKKLIQIEHALHRKGKMKVLFSKHEDSKKTIVNSVPSRFFAYVEYKMKQRFEMMSKMEKIPQPDNLNCIRYFEGETIGGLSYFSLKRINYRTLFSLASYYKSKTQDDKKTHEALVAWYNSIDVPLKRASLGTVNHRQMDILSKRSNGSAGCLYRLAILEELGVEEKVCKGCPYYFSTTDE